MLTVLDVATPFSVTHLAVTAPTRSSVFYRRELCPSVAAAGPGTPGVGPAVRFGLPQAHGGPSRLLVGPGGPAHAVW